MKIIQKMLSDKIVDLLSIRKKHSMKNVRQTKYHVVILSFQIIYLKVSQVSNRYIICFYIKPTFLIY